MYAFVIWGMGVSFSAFSSMHDWDAVFFFFFYPPHSSLLRSERVLQKRRNETREGNKKRGGRFVCTVADPGCIVTYGRREVAVEVISFDILAFFLHFFGGVFSFFSFLISLFALFFL